MTGPHVTELLAGFSLGILDDAERATVDQHVAVCAQCRQELAEVHETTRLLALIPADEAVSVFGQPDVADVPGPPIGEDLVLRRTLRAVRAERQSTRLRKALAVAAGVVALVAGSVGAGYAIGDRTAETRVAPSPTASATLPAGARVLTASDATTGVRATVTVVPAADWVRLAVKVQGVPPGERCRLVAVTRSGDRVVAGSWVVAQKPAPDAPPVQGSAVVKPTDLAMVEVVTFDGKRLVAVKA